MEHNELISVIIPVYNVEPYLNKCVQSVVDQTYKNLEIILVDDGSTDHSGEICDQWKTRDMRISVIHQENQGLSMARNAGIERAAGAWIAFLDSDDWIEPDMYQVLLELAKKYGVQLSSCASRTQILGEESNHTVGTEEITLFSPQEMIADLYRQEKVRFEVWNKLWSRELIGETRFIKGQVCEDVHFDRILFLKTDAMVFTNRCLHNYLINRPGSTCATFKVNRLCIFSEFEELLKDIQNMSNSHLEDIVSCIATNFALNFYEEAVDTKQSDEIKRELRQWFLHFYRSESSKRIECKKQMMKKKLFACNVGIFMGVRKLCK